MPEQKVSKPGKVFYVSSHRVWRGHIGVVRELDFGAISGFITSNEAV